MVNIKGKSQPTKPLNKKVTSVKASSAFKEERQKISAKANLKKSAPKKKLALDKNAPKAFAKVDDKNSGKDNEHQSKKNSLGPKVSKSKAGKKKAPPSLSVKSKKELPVDSSEDEKDVYSDSSLDSEDEDKILDNLKIKKEENVPTSANSIESLLKDSIISQETQVRLQTLKKKPAKKGDQGIIYVGRLPNGFEESELKVFFEQFGKINRLRLSRSKKNGASRHYAFIEFAYRKVAQIAAETMNNYLVSNRLLKCQLVPENKVHPGMVSKYKPPSISAVDKERAKLALPKTVKQLKRINARKLKGQNKLQAKLNTFGIEYKFPEFSAVKAAPEGVKPLPKAKEAKVKAALSSEATKSLPKSKKNKAIPEAVKSLPKAKETKVETAPVPEATKALPKSKKSKAVSEAAKPFPKAKETKVEATPDSEATKPLPKSKKSKAVPEAVKSLPKTKKAKVETKAKHSKSSA